ncbi:tRNA (guanosine(37)-N1)-methyltransferase TrmD [Candidatus Gottesmanbacteria bacterium CG_4_10_14_0_8_um_filter_37_24]|uniref:tRNA (guanine-N(1)-)-methyltransferase n=1 Tax=Candidatus Gottesmanbacteria bacterium CG_4_10_14_0_8_um_filter_37_24 TaxID=1974574 RepID=A0A2M7RPR2_9BACT|nr:MAG: tRNA (guanosine(37)-N1)-methyltransferase TrmD [Candidatus Gottesmanbacteria bacterium CG23_combo_of_CG06-09_8_20_14_all_37_19]PIZ02318.1 MAG: tRNA (guanosine(37)-N1)-methyltransferase TrmD [Candidatus Gottesmanbacteria bacterium CG_4_10_14_0_8_um_filter_37_24]
MNTVFISTVTLFPKIFKDIFSYSIIGRAQKRGLVNFYLIDIRDFAIGSYKTVDDKPYGGGKGMIIKVDVVHKAIMQAKINYREHLKQNNKSSVNCQLKINYRIKEKIILMDPKGKTYSQKKAFELSKLDHLILVCGHYEGIDARINKYIDESISIGDYILTGGEIPAMVIVDSVCRLVSGVLSEEAIKNESFSTSFTHEEPQFTRPYEYEKMKVPEVLLSGNHQKITIWKKKKQKKIN